MTTNEYKEQTYIRPKDLTTGFEVDQYDWVWIRDETGAWEGPRTDWEYEHKKNYFEFVTKFDVCVQAGGCQGMYPRMLATRFRHVYTFEPDPRNFYCLVNNTQMHNVSCFNAALGDRSTTVRVNRSNGSNVGMTTVAPDTSHHILQMTIDGLGLQHCDLICLDIEGYELAALIGAQHTMERFRPVIACENANEDIKRFLTDRRYQFAAQSVSDTVFRPI